MIIKFSTPISISQKDIDILSKDIDCPIPSNLRKFFFDFNGSKPEKNIFSVGKKNESGINKLIPASQIMEEKKHLDHVGKKIIPVAEAEGGNYVVIDLDRNQAVYFWDHEEPGNMTNLANNIYEFLEKLTPFNPNDVELKEGQVESAWIDPDFLKNLKS